MKTWLTTFLILLWPLSCLSAGEGESEAASEFRRANALYGQGQYGEAIVLYRKIREEGWTSSPLYFNLANSYFKEGDLGRAILNYRRARDLSPRDPEINKNLEYAREGLRDDISSLPRKPIARLRRGIARQFPFGVWLGVSSALYFLTIFWLLLVLLIRPLRKANPFVLKTLLPLLAVSLMLSISAYLYYRTPRAIVLEPEVSVRYGPKEDDAAAFELHEGTEVGIAREQDGWYQIFLPDGKSGWLPASKVEKI